ncbi:AzlC family ABC transporter permease [Halocalculus aciditolerans]|uniref:AzlC family protein n=1 Tax=Halocalculus aciditolerans TaxID=1383812 RepID=A0A830FFE4_9EURY|nr:AzlC family ABC transporter permease [Halocalculus aciditolerans]GGL49984.1 AzlC family protein [Halocalculus aciditolerans]
MNRDAFRAGVRDALPLLLGIVPFGLVSGVAAVDAGFSLAQAMGLSVFVFAGASQLAALSLVQEGAPALVVVATAVVINLRMGMYSASLAPHFREYTTRWKAAMAYVLTDQAYALSVARYRGGDVDKRPYYLGVALTLWVVWQAATVVGLVVGGGVPESWGLSFTVPLVFLALLVPAVEDRATGVAAAVGAVAGTLGAVYLPLHLGLLAGGLCGVAAGLLVDNPDETDDAGDETAAGGETAGEPPRDADATEEVSE